MNKYNAIGFPFRYQEEIKKRREFQQHFNAICKRYDFEEIEIPLLCPLKEIIGKAPLPLGKEDLARVFRGTVICNKKQMRSTVRYEGTTPIANLIASWGGLPKDTCSFYYFQEMIRLENEGCVEAYERAFFQLGLEAFSNQHETYLTRAAAVIAIISRLLTSLGLQFAIRFSHVSLIEKNLLENGFDIIQRKKIISLLEKKDFVALYFALNKMKAPQKVVKSLIHMAKITDVSIAEGCKYLQYQKLDRAYYELKTIRERLLEQDIDESNLFFDAQIHQSLNFYSGIIFRVDIDQVGKVACGGDFSQLLKHLGLKQVVHAVGIAAMYEKIILACSQHKEREKVH